MDLTRRSVLKAAAVATPLLNLGRFQLFADTNEHYSKRAIDLVQQATIIDMLNPFSLYAVMVD